jgi:DNA-binding response OmpR family regulator
LVLQNKTGIGSGELAIVVIDDNPQSLEYVSNVLVHEGVTILTAANAEEGLALIYAHRPQIVLTDIAMPGLSGLDVVQQVAKFDSTIQVIVMSARDSGVSATKALQLGAADYLAKPISLSVLRERVGRFIKAVQAKRSES